MCRFFSAVYFTAGWSPHLLLSWSQQQQQQQQPRTEHSIGNARGAEEYWPGAMLIIDNPKNKVF